MSLQAAEYVQQKLSETIHGIDTSRNAAEKKRNRRRLLAYTLKFITIFGGIAVASGLAENWAQIFGLAILIATGFDIWLSNSKALMIYAQAVNSYDALRKRVERDHTTQLIPIISLAEKQGGKASTKLVDMVTDLLKMSNVELTHIEKALHDGELETLKALEIENKNKTY